MGGSKISYEKVNEGTVFASKLQPELKMPADLCIVTFSKHGFYRNFFR